MIGTRYEEYGNFAKGLPFVFNSDIVRTAYNYSKERNWHEDLELELCTEGEGTVILNGEKFPFEKGDVAVVNSNVIHYTGTQNKLKYTCLIISAEYCRKVGFDISEITFKSLIKSERIGELLTEMKAVYSSVTPCRTAILHKILLEILIELSQKCLAEIQHVAAEEKSYRSIKNVIRYIRENYSEKILLDDISKAVFVDKYALCREFKKMTGQTVVHYINNYRIIMAADYISEGATVSEAATLCGFDNLSFFTKTFKRYTGMLPSQFKR